MMLKATLLYGRPDDPAAFERHYHDVHLPLATRVKGVRRLDVARYPGTQDEDGDARAFYRIAEFYFDDRRQMEEVMATPEMRAVVADLPRFASGGVTVMVCDVP